MEKLKKIIVSLLVLIMIACVPLSSTFAKKSEENIGFKKVSADKAGQAKVFKKKANKLKNTSGKTARAKETSYAITINKPKHNSTYYKGEKVKVSVVFEDAYSSFLTWPEVAVFNSKGTVITSYDSYYPLDAYEEATCTFTINTKSLANGKYTIGAIAWAYDDDWNWVDLEEDYGLYEEYAGIDFNVRTLKAPTKIKAKAGKKKVTLTFKKATGGKKYEIYRSTKKGKGYKKIKTTTAAKFTDKKAKKGKRYYYKVRTVRGSVKSSFSKPVRSKKVK